MWSIVLLVSCFLGFLLWQRNLLNKNTLFRVGFWFGYQVYTTRLGFYIHQRLLKQDRIAHSQRLIRKINDEITIVAVPMLSDNYGYIIVDTQRSEAVLVDGCDANAMLTVLDSLNIKVVKGILTTHYHWDHAGGNSTLLDSLTQNGRLPNIPIYGSKHESSSSLVKISHKLDDKETFEVGNLIFKSLYTPGHTKTDITYILYHTTKKQNFLDNTNLGWSLFTGDLLFSAGCGKFFEGEPKTMYQSLNAIRYLHSVTLSTIVERPELTKQICDENTLIWPGHEYTTSNLRFVSSIDNRTIITETLEWAQSQRSDFHPTIPSTLAKELIINPFLRCDDPTYTSLLSKSQEDYDLIEDYYIDSLYNIRKLKDDYK